MEELSTPLLDPEAASEQGLSRVERRKSSSSISEEELEEAYNRIISTAQAQGVQTAIDEAFDALDVTETGNLNRHDIVLFMRAAAGHTKLDKHDVNGSVVEAAVDALIHDAGGGDGESIIISRSQFRDIFERHPDMMSAFEDLEAAQNRRKNAIQIMTKGGDGEAGAEEEDEDEENEQVWMHEAVTHWKNKWITALWIAIYIAGNAFMFAYKATEYARHEEAQAVFGNCIIVARGCAHCLNLNALLVLLAMCKHFLTLMRKTPLRFCFPFDAIQEAHIMIGIVFGLLAASHTAAHICDFHRLGNADSDDIYALFRFDLPEGYSARWGWALSTRAGITGIIMVVCLIVSYSFAFNRRKRFNRFWYTHHLLLVMLICLCVHGTQNLLEPYKSLYFVIGPLVLYAIPRIWRETPLSSLEVVKVEVKRGDVVQLRLKKPWYYKGYVEAGMYGVLNVPEVSRTEWHPFTLTSAPPEDYIEFHFRRVGKWTGKVHDLLESRIANPPTVRVEGPIGASSQGFGDYAVIVLVGAGIGITPMISVLKQLLHSPGKVKRCFFYWTTRDRSAFLWFTDLMDEIFRADKKNMLQIRHFLTSVKHDDRDLGAVLLHHAIRAHHHRTDIDLLLGQQIHHMVEVGRPDWREELDGVKAEASAMGERKCGVFLCGPSAMAEAVFEASVELSKEDGGFHVYFSKETF